MQRRNKRGESHAEAISIKASHKEGKRAPEAVKTKKPPEPMPEDKNLKLAQKYMDAYVDTLAGEMKYRKENAYLTKNLDTINAELRNIKTELSEIKAQNESLTESIKSLDFMRLTIGGNISGLSSQYDAERTLESFMTHLLEKNDIFAGSTRKPANGGRNGLPKFEAEEFKRVFHPTEEELAETVEEKPEAPPKPSPSSDSFAASLPQMETDPEASSEPFTWDDQNFLSRFLEKGVPEAPAEKTPAFPPKQPEPSPEIPEAPPLTWTETNPSSEPEPAPAPAPKPEPEPESESPLAQMDLSQVMALMEKKPKNKTITILSNVLFYACMALLIIGAVTFAQSKDINKSLFGIRYYYIKTPSMEPVYPVGSVVFTKVTKPEDIKVGDDITVFIGDEQNQAYLTHRVVEITQDLDTNELAFRTKGVNNKSNDPSPYNANLLAGKVVFSLPFIGTVMTFVQSQLILVIAIFVLLLLLSFMLRLLFSKEEAPEAEAQPQPTQKQKKVPKKQQEELLRKIQADWMAKMSKH